MTRSLEVQSGDGTPVRDYAGQPLGSGASAAVPASLYTPKPPPAHYLDEVGKMKILISILQVIVALSLLNVWLVRFHQSTAYRGGGSHSMPEEFAFYGFSVGLPT